MKHTHTARACRSVCLGIAVILVSAWSVTALASQTHPGYRTGECDTDRFPEAAAFLEMHGYPQKDYRILLPWREQARVPGVGTVTGYRLAPADGGEPFDLYSDAEGRLLSDADLKRAGIVRKTWDLPPAEQLPTVVRQTAKSIQPKPRALSPTRGGHSDAWLALDPVDMGRVLAEDLEREQRAAKSAKRIGVFQTFPQQLRVAGAHASLGQWDTLSDGTRLWSARIYSPEAVAQRIHFAALDLPRGARVVVYNASFPEEAYGPYTGPYPGESDLWAASCFSDSVAVECVVPAGVPIDPVQIVIDQTAHIYADFATLPWGKALNEAGWCNLDVACYPNWHEQSLGVGGVGSITRGTGILWCTGSLIADSVPETDIPYFLTAEHCVGTPAQASTLEIYWIWQRDTCGGYLTPVYSVPRSVDGADLLVASAAPQGTDFALLRLRNQPPEELTYLGWTTIPSVVDTSVACIHHPSGDYKRISFGDLISGAAYSTVYRVGWNEGTTEGGSSGSPLMLTDTKQLIGQLWRGTASCSKPRQEGGWDEFGRFDVTFPLVAPWLGPFGAGGPADINQDGFLDAMDIQLVINAALGIEIDPRFDANVDGDPEGLVNAIDIQLVINAVLRI